MTSVRFMAATEALNTSAMLALSVNCGFIPSVSSSKARQSMVAAASRVMFALGLNVPSV